MTVRILTDSGSDLPLQFFEDNNITLFSLGVHLDGQDYEDIATINPIKVFEAMRNGSAPKTSQVPPHRFKEVFTEIGKQQQSAVYIAFSSQLSGTYQTAVMMSEEVKEEYPELDLTIIDTKCASLGQGLVVRAAAELASKGAPKEEVVDLAKFYSTHMEHLFTVDNLEYLARGGRISKASAFVGGLLNIKPLLNVEDGKLIPLEKIRGKKKVYKRIIELMEERGVDLSKQTIGISHADVKNEALELQNLFSEKFGCKSFFVNEIGAAIGSHVGPGTISIFFLNKITNT